jgi:hypothetical protein
MTIGSYLKVLYNGNVVNPRKRPAFLGFICFLCIKLTDYGVKYIMLLLWHKSLIAVSAIK